MPKASSTALAGKTYVAMGSSFAAGPGISPAAGPVDRCGRSAENYPHQLARLRGLTLIDVSCGGATTDHILGRWNELPAQIDAVTPETALVTITIGGNDVGFVGRLAWAACGQLPAAQRDPRCREVPPLTEQTWQALAASLRTIVTETRARAPRARIVFVDYVSVLPVTGSCAQIGMPIAGAAANRAIADRLAAVTAAVARDMHADVLQLSRLSRNHSACDPEPWASGYPISGAPPVTVPFHPNLAGMTAAAGAIDTLLKRR